jgi:hypothetical protein
MTFPLKSCSTTTEELLDPKYHGGAFRLPVNLHVTTQSLPYLQLNAGRSFIVHFSFCTPLYNFSTLLPPLPPLFSP